MQIRTITAGAREEDVPRVARAAQEARRRLEDAGYTVQTLRLALAAVGSNRCADFPTIARGAEDLALEAGFDYVSIGRVDRDRLPHLPEALAATQALFASAQIAGPDGAADLEALRLAAEVIVALGAGTELGLGNLRFAALACVPPGSPFLPAAYHDGGAPWVAVGPEGATLAVEATQAKAEEPTLKAEQHHPSAFCLQPSTLARLTALIEHHDARIARALAGLDASGGVRFAGCDWSLTPHPDPARSIGAAAEAISGVPFGAWGTLAAIRSLTGAVRAAKVTQLGFSGVMLPVLEDAVLARRNAEGRYTVRDLLAFSSVCGTGLDCVPLPGDTMAAEVSGVLAEVAALAGALRKPLTARLMPLPGLAAGDTTAFAWEYFVNTRVMRLG
ncbi:MAG: hypothetical protein RLZZ387_5026 [Chloroflexota bacterium]|jgi:uncharacterized protein (UPF0210 family)